MTMFTQHNEMNDYDNVFTQHNSMFIIQNVNVYKKGLTQNDRGGMKGGSVNTFPYKCNKNSN